MKKTWLARNKFFKKIFRWKDWLNDLVCFHFITKPTYISIADATEIGSGYKFSRRAAVNDFISWAWMGIVSI